MRRTVVAPTITLAALAALVLLLAPLLPAPANVTEFRVAAYGAHAVWFALVTAFALAIGGSWRASRLVTAIALVTTFALVVVLNVADVDVASDVAKLTFGGLAGAAFIRVIERPWWLLPISVLVPLADAWSVFSSRGVTHAVVERAREEPRWIDWPTIATPIAGLDYDTWGRIGIVDVLFLTIMITSAARWELGLRRALVLLPIALLGTSVLVFEGADIAIPALPLLCVAFLVAAGPALVRDARDAWRAAGPPPADA